MFSTFFPTRTEKSTYKIDFEEFYQQGFRGIIFDIDNTLVEHGKPASVAAIALFRKLDKLGFKTVLLSNNKEPRVKSFFDEVHATDYIYKADKPLSRNYYKAMDIMGTTKENTLFVGDQLFTDVWGAKRIGIYNILVEPIDKKEEIQIVLKRYLEKIVLYFYRREQHKNDRN